MMSVAEIVNKVGGRKFILTIAGAIAVAWLTTQGVEPEQAWPIVAAVLGGVFGIAAEDMMRGRQQISDAAMRAIKIAAAEAARAAVKEEQK